MKVLAFNGSPRKKWNTATLLEKALEGAASAGAETELIHLYDLDYKGCISCFSCKTKGGPSYGRCAFQDDLTPVLDKAAQADALILGSPIYIGTVSGEMRSFMERLLFPYISYAHAARSLFPRKINTGFIYTMNLTEEQMKVFGFDQHPVMNKALMKRVFGASDSLFSFDTYQFEDYSKMDADRWDPDQKAARRREVFPLDCQKAFDMGARFARG
jgi:multimeric flavodoxin WrbA